MSESSNVVLKLIDFLSGLPADALSNIVYDNILFKVKITPKKDVVVKSHSVSGHLTLHRKDGNKKPCAHVKLNNGVTSDYVLSETDAVLKRKLRSETAPVMTIFMTHLLQWCFAPNNTPPVAKSLTIIRPATTSRKITPPVAKSLVVIRPATTSRKITIVRPNHATA
jgi:hypothetical protein